MASIDNMIQRAIRRFQGTFNDAVRGIDNRVDDIEKVVEHIEDNVSRNNRNVIDVQQDMRDLRAQFNSYDINIIHIQRDIERLNRKLNALDSKLDSELALIALDEAAEDDGS